MDISEKMNEIISLSKRRGFIFQSSEIYGGLKSCYDYGPLGIELKRSLASEWWRHMVHTRDNIYGLDASIMMHPKVWKASGHLKNFSDPLVDCFHCKERFRADKAPRKAPGTTTEVRSPNKKSSKTLKEVVGDVGYVCPNCGSSRLSSVRQFRCMFETTMGPVDPIFQSIEQHYDKGLSKEDFLSIIREEIDASAVYLRPETAQAMFVQFNNVVQTTSAKIPFGIAQIGKSFRNEIIVEHFIFRSCEFEQMEMEFFCKPGEQKSWLKYWCKERMDWYNSITNDNHHFRFRQHEKDELAHYSDDCYDIEYKFPWGWDELEGIASRTDYDLKKHSEYSGAKLSYFDPLSEDPTGKKGWRYTPYVIEPAAGLTRLVLCVLLDAYTVEEYKDTEGKKKKRTYLKLNPKLAPFKLAVLPLVKKEPMISQAKDIAEKFRKASITVSFDTVSSIGKRYAKHDEIGTPWCVTVDQNSSEDQKITIRNRDTREQQRIPIASLYDYVVDKLKQ